MISELKAAALDGEANALSAYITLKEIEAELKDAIDKVKPLALAEAKNYEETTFSAFGAKVTVKSGGGRWSYDHIPAWKEAKEKVTELEKAAQSAYKNSKIGMLVSEEGEVVSPARYTEGEEQISVTLDKWK